MKIPRGWRKYRLPFLFAAGHWSAAGETTGRYLARLIREFPDVVLIGTTESQDQGVLAEVRAELPDGWAAVKAGEFLAVHRLDTIRLDLPSRTLAAVVVRFTDVPGLPDWQNVFAGRFRFRHVASQRRFKVFITHSNSGIEWGDGLRSSADLKVQSARTGLTRLGRRARAAARTGAPRLVARAFSLVIGDFNLDQKRPAQRRRLGSWLNGESIFARGVRTIGDHRGGRLIVGAFLYGWGVEWVGWGRVVPDREVPMPDEYDHRPLRGVIQFLGRA
ncbi:hypothetical protein [Nocardioides sp. 503]|uniref:hypothetical protein n=1 Tax=Nocardioides sp. 503 TaxID=2508326 RepID=UPI00106F3BF0|nr:hypothetical protein [Nocardioides sp. 503]